MVGLPGAGKTTRAKEIEEKQSALRLNGDEWIIDLYGHDLDREKRDAVRDPIQSLQWGVAKRVLELGGNVILDWAFWLREERDTYRNEAEALGAKVHIVFLDAAAEERWSRVSKRPESAPHKTLGITREEFDEWTTLFEPPDQDELL